MNFELIFGYVSGDIWQKVVKIGKNTEGVIKAAKIDLLSLRAINDEHSDNI